MHARPRAEMKRALYAICSQFGTVMDIVVMKTFRLRGQAWVVFEDLAMAANAMRSLNGFDLFDKEMVRARNRSSAHGGRGRPPRAAARVAARPVPHKPAEDGAETHPRQSEPPIL